MEDNQIIELYWNRNEKAIAETMADRQAKQIAQEEAKQDIKRSNEIANLLSFKKARQAFATN